MEKHQFDEAVLGKNYEFKTYDTMKIAKLFNTNVRIAIVIYEDNPFLETFHNDSRVKRIARCSLLWLLKKLLTDNLIEKEQIIKVSNPRPNDGNMENLIRIYKEIGFTHGKPEPGNPVNLFSTIQNLITTLGEQCAITTVQCAGGKHQFDEAELGKNYVFVSDKIFGTYAKLENENVNIVIAITQHNLDLEAFYNKNRKLRIARCSLLWLLKKLLNDNLITKRDKIIVSCPVPRDGNLGKLIRIYEDIGFDYKNYILESTIGHLLGTLEEQCAITTVQCAGGSSLRF